MTIALMCVPFAGAGATLFRPWRGHPSTTFAVTPLQLPGREEEFVDEPCTTMAEAAALCARRVRQAAADGPFALFGHSFGALLAYETARLLSAEGPHRPERLIVSGAAAPWVPRPRLGGDGLTDEEFLTRLNDLVGYDHPSLHDEDLRELLLPALRADMAIHDGYPAPDPAAPALPVPVSVLRGTDDSLVSKEDAAQWSRASAADTELIDLPGGHMYFLADWRVLWDEIEAIFLRAAEPDRQGVGS